MTYYIKYIIIVNEKKYINYNNNLLNKKKFIQ
jgi:hypothetical protein